jgi:hypothetical protein
MKSLCFRFAALIARSLAAFSSAAVFRACCSADFVAAF